MDLEDKILNRIKRENIRIRPRWFFYAKDISQCFAAFIMLAFSAFLAGASLSALSLQTVLLYALAIVSALSLFFSYLLFVRSFSFYKIRTFSFVVSLAILVLAFGYLIFVYGQSDETERGSRYSSAYEKIFSKTLRVGEKNEKIQGE